MNIYLANTYEETKTLTATALTRGDAVTIHTGSHYVTYRGPEVERLMAELDPATPSRIVEVQPMVKDEQDTHDYAWVVTVAHQAPGREPSNKWRTGPEAISGRQMAMLGDGAPLVDGYERHIFHVYTEDGTPSFSGRSVFQANEFPNLDALAAPLVQCGELESVTGRIKWEGHPDWEIE